MLHCSELQLPAAQAQTKTSYSLAYLSSWHYSIFGYKLRTIRLKILKKLRTASLDSEFAGSYKKSVIYKNMKNVHPHFKYCKGSGYFASRGIIAFRPILPPSL